MRKVSTYLKICSLAVLAYFFVGEHEVSKYVLLSQDSPITTFLNAQEVSSLKNLWDTPFAAIQSGTIITNFQELSRLIVKIGRPLAVSIKSPLPGEEALTSLLPLYVPAEHDAGYYLITLRKLRI